MFLALAIAGCRGGFAPQPGAVDLNGSWNLSLAGISARFKISEAADSASGNATYSMNAGNPPGCGGESIQPNGTATLWAKISGTTLTGRMTFNNQWTPPFNATIASPDTISGNLMSVDRGGCAFILVRKK